MKFVRWIIQYFIHAHFCLRNTLAILLTQYQVNRNLEMTKCRSIFSIECLSLRVGIEINCKHKPELWFQINILRMRRLISLYNMQNNRKRLQVQLLRECIACCDHKRSRLEKSLAPLILSWSIFLWSNVLLAYVSQTKTAHLGCAR